MPEDLEDLINAEIVHRGEIKPPDIQPGMGVKYFPGRMSKKYRWANVTRVELKNELWWVYLIDSGDSSEKGNVRYKLPEKFKNPVPMDNAQFDIWYQDSNVNVGETVQLRVRDGPSLLSRMFYTILKKPRQDTREVVARVLTAADVAQDPFVYLSNFDGTEIYVARLSDLPENIRKGNGSSRNRILEFQKS